MLVTAIILQHLHASFYELLISERSSSNPIEEFLDYVQVREKLLEPPDNADDPYWDAVRRSSRDHRLQLPEEPPIQPSKLTALLERLEREIPEEFPALARNSAFTALMRRIQEADSIAAFREHLLSRPLSTASDNDLSSIGLMAEPGLRGWRIICVDDNPDSLNLLVNILEDLGASLRVYSSPEEADQGIRRWQPHAVISDITRGDDPSAGFKYIRRLRDSGYNGPVVFFTTRVTPERRRQSEELGAADIVTTERDVIDALIPRSVSDVYTCPRGDYRWYRPSKNDPVPSCPTHGIALVSAA